MPDELLKPTQVQAEYGLNVQLLANWRWAGTGPDYIKTSPAKAGRVLYRRAAIERFLQERTVSQGGAA
ncbi:DNA-binding protein [Streptomyces sp. S.PB5]|uniref:DNA-binding protein n=1 Tax=Streptomyces sp. S.PB5 TaxID=3020844 RepID=UPI0025B128B5|nr:DNA-binding protein [Streptomyces sp. S.PB5]MDN3023816.1 DNA-binding protein [Streptomyces sp. S.PB5]